MSKNTNCASFETSADFIYPLIIEHHPAGLAFTSLFTRLGIFPEVIGCHHPDQLDGVPAPSASCCKAPET
jgi:hypothetical protein